MAEIKDLYQGTKGGERGSSSTLDNKSVKSMKQKLQSEFTCKDSPSVDNSGWRGQFCRR